MSSDCIDWQSVSREWGYAYGAPTASGQIKTQPDDFRVIECMDVEPDGEGEHVWLHITKTRQNTDQVAKALARHASVAYRDVGYSGLKDYYAKTDQWFSVWSPNDDVDWSEFDMSGVVVNQIARHRRKIKRGTHRSNKFVIVIRGFNGDIESFRQKVQQLSLKGVPNYFGEQRFGRDFHNMQQALDLFASEKKIKNRNMRSLLYSSARSWLFNCIVSERLELNTWDSLYLGEPANLNNSGSIFSSQDDANTKQRLQSLDIHPTAAMFGLKKSKIDTASLELEQLEARVFAKYQSLCDGLMRSELSYQRRPIRMQVTDLQSQQVDDGLELSFELNRGQYATSVLRELIISQTTP